MGSGIRKDLFSVYLYQIVKRERNLSRHRYCPPVLYHHL
nr:MAG TPA: hypothetical protein [Caudoviricetes sp.]